MRKQYPEEGSVDNLIEMAAFAEVVEQGSFTAAAERLGASKSFVSKQISALEARLGVQLLRRTTRKLVLTEEGRTFHDYCRRMVETAREGQQVARSRAHEVSGHLRVSAPVTYGQVFLAPLVREFCARYPQVEVDLVLDNRRVDLLTEDFDLAIRITEHPPQTLSVTSLGMMQDVICAAPAYLRDRMAPATPEDLRDHDCLLYLNPHRMRRWTFRKADRVQIVEVHGPAAYNYHSAVLEPLLGGAGVAKLPDYFVAPFLADGRLIRLLASYQCDQLPIYLLHHDPKGQPPRVRQFLAFALARLGVE